MFATPTTRRGFLQAGAATLGGLALSGFLPGALALARIPLRDPAELDAECFERQLGTRVLLRDAEGTRIPTRIQHVTRHPARRLRDGRRLVQYSVVMRAAGGTAAPQGTFELEHPEIGRCPLFLVPVDSRPGHVDYEAVFGHLVR